MDLDTVVLPSGGEGGKLVIECDLDEGGVCLINLADESEGVLIGIGEGERGVAVGVGPEIGIAGKLDVESFDSLVCEDVVQSEDRGISIVSEVDVGGLGSSDGHGDGISVGKFDRGEGGLEDLVGISQ